MIGRKEDHLGICQFPVDVSTDDPHMEAICTRIMNTAAISATGRQTSVLNFWAVSQLINLSTAGAYNEYVRCRRRLHVLYPVVYLLPAPQPYPGTLDWVERHEAYRTWLDCRSSAILHIYGRSGSGKSVLSAYLLRKLRRKVPEFDPAAVISHSFDKADNRRDSLRSLLLSFIQQLLGQGQSVYGNVKDMYESMEQRSNWTAVDLWAFFRSVVSCHRTRPIICVVDAPDQCRCAGAEFWSNIIKLQQQTDSPFKFLITSQPEEDIRPRLGSFFTIDLEKEGSDADKNITINGRLSALQAAAPTIETVKKQLSDSSFLEIDLTMACLERSISTVTSLDPELGLQPKPPTLSDVCESQLREILALPAMVQEWASKALYWLLFSVCPLTVGQLAVAVALDCGAGSVAEIRRLLNLQERNPADALHRNLGVLIKIEDSEIHFTHHSMRGILRRQGRDNTLDFEDSSECHSRLAKACLKFLSLDDFKDVVSFSEPQSHLPALNSECSAFLKYATRHWPQHFREAFGDEALITDASLLRSAVKFLEDKHQVTRWFELYNLRETRFRNTGPPIHTQDLGDNTSSSNTDTTPEAPLLIASRLGLARALTEILRAGNYTIDEKTMALETAAEAGYAVAVEAIMELGSMEKQLFPALKKACSKGHIAVVKGLLGYKTDNQDGLDDCLNAAAANGHTGVVSALIGLNIKAAGSEPLIQAATNGYEAVVLELLRTKADTGIWESSDRMDACGRALYSAAECGHLAAVQALLSDASSDANASPGHEPIKPLHLAATNGHASVVKELLKMKADVEAVDRAGRTSLHRAALEGHTLVITELLDARANPSPMERYSQNTPLHLAAYSGHLEVVSLLLSNGADPDPPNYNRCRPLHLAAQNGHNAIVRKLLESGVNEDPVIDDSKTTPLHLACLIGHAQVVRSLLDHDADTSRKIKGAPRDGYTPLHLSAENFEITKILVEAGAPLQAVSEDGNTPMHLSVKAGNKDVSKLLERNTPTYLMSNFNKAGLTPLHIALEEGFLEIAAFLVSPGGAKVCVADDKKRSLLFWCGGLGDENAIKFLLERGADMDKNIRDGFGRSPLDITLRPSSRALLLDESQPVSADGESRPKCRLLDSVKNVRQTRSCDVCFESLQGKFHFRMSLMPHRPMRVS